jgi:hypothetical protein
VNRTECPPFSRRAFVVGAAAVLALGAGATPAAADDARSAAPPSAQPAGAVPAGFTTWAELFAVQDKLNAAAERIVATGSAGYAGIVAAPQNRALKVHWKGEVPASVRQLASGLGVPVAFLPARFSEREMLAETKRLAADPRVLDVGPAVDGSGLTITVSGASGEAFRFGVLSTARLPLHVKAGPGPVPVSRANDFSPYVGGARYFTPINGCSTGFAVQLAGASRMLSAGHCGNNGHIAVDFGANPAVDTMGAVFNDNDVRDTLMINTSSFGHIYVGAFTSSATRDVVGTANDFVGNVICTGGGRTGEHCGMTVSDVNLTAGGFSPMNRAAFPGATCAVARGDSGGPVYHFSGNNIIGRGTISLANVGTASCPNAPVADSSRTVFYAPLTRPVGGPTIGSLQFYGASIL